MSTNTQGSDARTEPHTPAPTTTVTWMRTPITVTVERWVPVAAGLGALLLVLLALD